MKTKTRLYVGIGRDFSRTVFRSEVEPSFASHGEQYCATIGPFRTKRGAEFMRDHGRSNPHCQCVNDAERIAAGFAYDLVLRKWVRTRASVIALDTRSAV